MALWCGSFRTASTHEDDSAWATVSLRSGTFVAVRPGHWTIITPFTTTSELGNLAFDTSPKPSQGKTYSLSSSILSMTYSRRDIIIAPDCFGNALPVDFLWGRTRFCSRIQWGLLVGLRYSKMKQALCFFSEDVWRGATLLSIRSGDVPTTRYS